MLTKEEALARYFPELRHILEGLPIRANHPEPSEIYSRVYIGTVANAENLKLLNKYGITHVLNCDGIPVIRPEREARYWKLSNIMAYEEIAAQDTDTYDILHNFPKCFKFIDSGRKNGRVLIYSPDVNRNGAIALGYLLHQGISLLEAAKILKSKRSSTLFNRGFMKQLIIYAKDHNVLLRSTRLQEAAHFQSLGNIKHRQDDSHLLKFL